MEFVRIPTAMKDDIFMTRDELMHLLRIKASTLQRLMKRRDFPRWFKLERRVLFRRVDIEKWISGRRVK